MLSALHLKPKKGSCRYVCNFTIGVSPQLVVNPDMARSLRIEKAKGIYHIINRGNYRRDLFINEGAHASFERCLFEACVKCGWVLEGWCVMTNHFHLVVRTPKEICGVFAMAFRGSTGSKRNGI